MKRYIKSSEELGTNLKRERKRLKLKQKEVAAMLGVERSTYAYQELGKSKLSVLDLIKLSEIFKISVESLIYVE